jgi:hypothetical protein
MRFSNGKYNEKAGDGLNGAYSWTVIFDDEDEKLKYAGELLACLKAYKEKLDAETWNLLALPKENGSITAATKEIAKLYCQMLVIRNLADATMKHKVYEYDFVFIAERDQGVGKFFGKEPCLEISTAPAYIEASTREVLKSWTQKNSGSGASGKPALRSIN